MEGFLIALIIVFNPPFIYLSIDNDIGCLNIYLSSKFYIMLMDLAWESIPYGTMPEIDLDYLTTLNLLAFSVKLL